MYHMGTQTLCDSEYLAQNPHFCDYIKSTYPLSSAGFYPASGRGLVTSQTPSPLAAGRVLASPGSWMFS